MDSVASYTLAFLFAFLVHGMVVALITINWDSSPIDLTDIQPYYIDATVVSENPYTAKKEREADQAKTRRDKRIRQRRLDEAALNRQQAKWEEEQKKKKAEPVQTRTVGVIEPEPKPLEEKQEVDKEQVRSAFEEELSLGILNEQNARRAVTDDEKAMAYVAQIQRGIIQNWSRPPSARNGMQAILRVHLVPTGEVIDVKLEESSGNAAFDRSAVLAVRKSERFVVPSEALRFERDFRVFTVLFRPDDLRL